MCGLWAQQWQEYGVYSEKQDVTEDISLFLVKYIQRFVQNVL
jgi:hypothetical protein